MNLKRKNNKTGSGKTLALTIKKITNLPTVFYSLSFLRFIPNFPACNRYSRVILSKVRCSGFIFIKAKYKWVNFISTDKHD